MRGRFIFIVLLILCSAGMVSARQVLQADQCVVRTDERVQGNLFTTCRTLVVDGRITGDLIGAAATAQINGTVEGSVYLLSGQLDVFGTIGQDLHYVGPRLRVHPGAVIEAGDLISVALSTTSSVPVPGSVISAGYQTVLEESVGREVDFWGTSLTIDASIGGDVNAAVGDPASAGVAELRALLTPLEIELRDPGLYVGQEGAINGQLTYSGQVEGEILAELPTPPIFYQMPSANDIAVITESQDLLQSLRIYVTNVLREIITLSLVGILALLLLPRIIQAPVPTMRMRTLPSIGVGLLTFILSFPVFFILIMLSALFVVVLSLLQLPQLTLISGLIVGVVDFSIISLFYFIAFIVSRVIFALALGGFLTRRLSNDATETRSRILSLLVGVIVLSIVSSLPLIGWLFNALAVFLGLGAILTLIHEELQKTRTSPQGALATTIPGQPAPPPVVADEPRAPGLDNLPDGFDWWD